MLSCTHTHKNPTSLNLPVLRHLFAPDSAQPCLCYSPCLAISLFQALLRCIFGLVILRCLKSLLKPLLAPNCLGCSSSHTLETLTSLCFFFLLDISSFLLHLSPDMLSLLPWHISCFPLASASATWQVTLLPWCSLLNLIFSRDYCPSLNIYFLQVPRAPLMATLSIQGWVCLQQNYLQLNMTSSWQSQTAFCTGHHCSPTFAIKTCQLSLIHFKMEFLSFQFGSIDFYIVACLHCLAVLIAWRLRGLKGVWRRKGRGYL